MHNGKYSNIDKESVLVIIPAYNPSEELIELVNSIISSKPDAQLIIVNDGSNQESENIFSDILKFQQCVVLHHNVNLGKGQALKTAFNYVEKLDSPIAGVITVDADGQHGLEDILNCIDVFNQNKQTVILGSRQFYKKDIPFRSRFGNNLTRIFLKIAHGITLSDSQTGLRVIPFSLLKSLIVLPGERYEYEMDMLMYFKKNNIALKEVPIATIYLNDNQSSHFNPIVDSIKIYSVFFKYGFSSLLAFAIDIVLFVFLLSLFASLNVEFSILLATVGSRSTSSIINYITNGRFVFKAIHSTSSVARYFTLVFFQMLLSGLLVQTLSVVMWILTPITIKLVVDVFLFVISFQVQKIWVFKQQKAERSFSLNEK
ncbi:glycosyltransferase [Marinilactibacillus sp. GCM10026970]|uniref:glycosyltransferase n=1 Tax=Marinilactibacillus sp. GCM10026970 TaxID=3252642 RepID=UPI00361C885D